MLLCAFHISGRDKFCNTLKVSGIHDLFDVTSHERLPGVYHSCSPIMSTLASRHPSRHASGSNGTTASGVRRDKAALSSGCKSHPATAPAGSNRSSCGGNEMAEAFG